MGSPRTSGPRAASQIHAGTTNPYSKLAVDILVLAGFPIAVGRAAIRTADDVVSMLKVLAGAGVVYAPLVLLEARISPQLHLWLYGFAPFDERAHASSARAQDHERVEDDLPRTVIRRPAAATDAQPVLADDGRYRPRSRVRRSPRR